MGGRLALRPEDDGGGALRGFELRASMRLLLRLDQLDPIDKTQPRHDELQGSRGWLGGGAIDSRSRRASATRSLRSGAIHEMAAPR
ncbi:hypothetical protein M6B38_340745 [Iris pallida]|uniref:Uncharacterized protein n=1 Tax=Iris pallida TaxID=29817 RepID=A0AAX6GX58_IRIPA|nr:hypothetical protein M6B38_340745 [Iris pallida]